MPANRIRAKKLTKPRQVAAIDIGSTSVRMCVAEISPAGGMSVLSELVHPVAVGHDTFTVGHITPETLRALCTVLTNFAAVVKEYEAECLAVATSSVRDASNCDLVVDRIRHESGIQLSVIDAVEESRLTCQVLLPFLEEHVPSRKGHTLFVDLGGGSTETLLLKGANIVLASNRRLGTARLFQSISGMGDRQMLQESVIRNVVTSTMNHFQDYTIHECVVTNTLVERALLRTGKVKEIEGGIEATKEVFFDLLRSLRRCSTEEMAERAGLSLAEAELLMPAMLTLERLFEEVGVKRFFMAELELLTSVLYDLRMSAWGQNPLLEFGEQVVRSAKGLGERYDYDAPHAVRVAKLAVQMYDGLADFLDLAGKDRLYLEVAGILHDIGMFIGDEGHHKHSQYLIEWSEIVGFNREERSLIAQIARYHRKALPSPLHEGFMRWPLAQRLRISKLAAILRAADALDRSHLQAITDVKVTLDKTMLTFEIEGESDLVVERVAMEDKGLLLREVTGLNIELVRKG